jgi:hypothetical protein
MSSNTDNIINATEFKPSDVKYSKPKLNKAGGKAVGILNFKTNKSLYLRTPLMMTWGVNKFEDKATGKVTYDMALQFPRDDYRSDETDKFLAAMVAFQDQVKADVLANSKEWLNKAKMTAEVVDNLFHPMLKYPKDLSTGECDLTKSPSLKLKLSYWDNKFDCEIYDLASTMLFPNEATPAITPLELIPKLSNVAVIIQCGGVWLANGKCGVTWKLFQAAVKPKPSMKGKCFLSFAGEAATQNKAGAGGGGGGDPEDYEDDEQPESVPVQITEDSDDEEPVIHRSAQPVVPVEEPVEQQTVPVVAAATVVKKVVKKKV